MGGQEIEGHYMEGLLEQILDDAYYLEDRYFHIPKIGRSFSSYREIESKNFITEM